MELQFGNSKTILILKWTSEWYKKLKNPKVLFQYIKTDEQKELFSDYKEVRENMKGKNKFDKKYLKIKAENIYEEIMKPIMKREEQYYIKHFDSIVVSKRQEYIAKMKKKLKTEREIIVPF